MGIFATFDCFGNFSVSKKKNGRKVHHFNLEFVECSMFELKFTLFMYSLKCFTLKLHLPLIEYTFIHLYGL